MTSDHVAEAHTLLTAFQSRDGQDEATAFWDAHLPADEDRRRKLAEAFDRIGVEAFNDRRLEAARDAFWGLFVLRLAKVKGRPDDRATIRDFASAEDQLGLALLELNRIAPAEQMLTEAHRYRAGLWRDEPSDPHAAYLYGVALWHMAKLERAKGDRVREAEWVDEARRHLTAVDADWPGVSFIVDELAAVEERLGKLGMARADPPPERVLIPEPPPGFWRRIQRLFL